MSRLDAVMLHIGFNICYCGKHYVRAPKKACSRLDCWQKGLKLR